MYCIAMGWILEGRVFENKRYKLTQDLISFMLRRNK